MLMQFRIALLRSLCVLGASRRLGGSVLLLICVVALTGCKTTVTPPANVRDPVMVGFTDYGRHTSILLPTGNHQWAEYAAGDWSFFALGHNSAFVGVKALLGMGEWTIGRRTLDVPPTDPRFANKFELKRVVLFQAERSYAETLRETLDALFKVHADHIYYSHYSGLYHVTGDEHYYLFHNCNHSTANWLRLLGCDVNGSSITSSFELATSPRDAH